MEQLGKIQWKYSDPTRRIRSYTWSHALDDISNGGSALVYSHASSLQVIGSPSLRGSYSNADYDVRHNVVADFLWNTPVATSESLVGQSREQLDGGCKIFLRSGTPFSIIDGELAPNLSPNIIAAMLASYQLSSPITRHCGPSAVNTPCFSLSQFVPSLQETGYGNVATDPGTSTSMRHYSRTFP